MTSTHYDVVILGSGPAGLQAAIHAARKKVSVLIIGNKAKSSLYKAHVENYCCLDKVSGETLLNKGVEQAEAAGARLIQGDVIKTSQADDGFVIQTEGHKIIHCNALIMAMGITRNRLGAKGEKAFLGRGVSYCVDCDANFYRDQPVAVVGNGSAALSGALTLLFYTSKVHLIAEKLDVTQSLVHQIKESHVNIHLGRKVKTILGEDQVKGVILDDGSHLNVEGVFIESGAKGAVELAATLGVALDQENFQYITADKNQQTNVPGIFAAGDITGLPWQMAKAVGEGCVAGISAAKYVKKMKS